ncbi:MAG: sigma-70 family RNA polymerase sigma factor [Leptolyngbyaceae bacterium]|nr:sigma-70 family RNA polymerase sigma factor [Leptolyngbyaceae bacterium]
MVQIPSFPECKHDVVEALAHHTDQALLTLFQRQPEAGQYFLAIFCRYSPIVYTLIQHSARSPVQANYLFALTWRHIYHELRGLDLHEVEGQRGGSGQLSEWVDGDGPSPAKAATLQNWLINITAVCINSVQLPPTESIHYALDKVSPPLWCYIEQSLSQLSPTQRIVLLLSQTFHWSKVRIAAYLKAEGEVISTEELEGLLQNSYRLLKERLPEDIQAIYLPLLETVENEALGAEAIAPPSPGN